MPTYYVPGQGWADRLVRVLQMPFLHFLRDEPAKLWRNRDPRYGRCSIRFSRTVA